MKTIALINWVLLAVYALLVIYANTDINRSGNDAAGRGMESGLVFFAIIVLVALIVLNILPYRFPKILALVVLSLPAIFGLFSGISTYLELQKQRRNVAGQENGSAYFTDTDRQNIAAAVAAGDVDQLKSLLQKPQPLINECGHQSMTLLDFAAIQTAKSDNPQPIMQCMELLMAHGATIQGPDTLHAPTQFQICEIGSAALLEWFLNKGADPNAIPHDGSPIIFKVLGLDNEQLKKVRILLDKKANPNAVAGKNEYTIRPLSSILMYAAQRQMWDICHLLLERGADPGYRTPEGNDLKTVMEQLEKSFADQESTPEAYPVFKAFLNTKVARK